MTTYISSLIQPVVRRFSSAPPDLPQSHVRNAASPDVSLDLHDEPFPSIDDEATQEPPSALPGSAANSGSASRDASPHVPGPALSRYDDERADIITFPVFDESDGPPPDVMATGSHAPPTYNQLPSSLATNDHPPSATSLPSSAMTRRLLGSERESSRSRRAMGSSAEATFMSGSLPADDGMSGLRRQILAIRDMAASNEEKARRLHSLMMERYFDNNPHLARAQSPASVLSSDRPFTPGSPFPLDSLEKLSHSPGSTADNFDPEHPFNLTEEDQEPCYRPPRSRRPSIDYEYCNHDDSDAPEPSEPQLGCRHYKRNVKIQCFDCRSWYPCRHCHDEQETSHHLPRRKTDNMFCMLCKTPQPAGEVCVKCEQSTAYYYCDICKLWDDDASKRIYHCADCGICRRGEGIGKDYVHCKKCNICIAIASAPSHRCIERAAECDCPICGEYMFTSSSSIVAMPCGHYLHKTCYTRYMEDAYKCPICKKSAVNMELQWRKLEHSIEAQPMPEQLRDTKVVIQCNDCSGKSSVKYHWLGNKCATCDSFNTNEVALLGRDWTEQTSQAQQRNVDNVAQMREETRPRFPWTRSRTLPSPSEQLGVPPRSSSGTVARAAPTRSPGSYFLSVQDSTVDDHTERRNSNINFDTLASGIPFSPLEMFQRVSRSWSPIRHYLNGSDDEYEGFEGEGSDEDVDFWGSDGRFLSGEEESDEDESERESEGSSEEDDDDDEDDESEGEGEEVGERQRTELDDLDDMIGHR